MLCPHCQTEISVTPHVFALGEDKDGSWQVSSSRCPVCERLLVNICTKDGCTYPAWPATSSRPRLTEDVPAEFADEYLVASQIIPYSPEASAAISRRLLHRFLAGHTKVGAGGLAQQIDRATRSSELPAYLKDALQTLARIAKLEPGSEKSKRPEMLIEVEPGEAEWLLDVLHPLFELFFVQPAITQRRQNAVEEMIEGGADPDGSDSDKSAEDGDHSDPALPAADK
jgi:hypothetical protein